MSWPSIKTTHLSEQSIYGSSRLGLINYASKTGYRSLGGKKYELSNHLGNVLAVVSDNIHLDQDSTWTSLINTTDYYPFGLAMDGRSEQDSSYRYGFNGKEEDSNGEWGGQSHYDYGFRIYNPGIAKFLSVDPLAGSYPMLTPYQFASNTPIYAIDLDGLEMLPGYLDYTGKVGFSLLKKIDATQKRADSWERTHKIIHKKEPSVLDKAGYYFEATMHNFGEYTDAEDFSVLTQGETVRGDDATALDYTFAAGGAFIPFVSGGAIKQTLKGFFRVLDGSNADNFFTKRGISSFKEFYQKTRKLKSGERIAEFKKAGARVANGNNWTKNNKLSKRFDRDVYNDVDGSIYSLDTRHGEFEVLDKNGSHKGAVDFEGTKVKDADSSGGHDFDLK